jgi:hypothetical protein
MLIIKIYFLNSLQNSIFNIFSMVQVLYTIHFPLLPRLRACPFSFLILHLIYFHLLERSMQFLSLLTDRILQDLMLNHLINLRFNKLLLFDNP